MSHFRIVFEIDPHARIISSCPSGIKRGAGVSTAPVHLVPELVHKEAWKPQLAARLKKRKRSQVIV